MGNEFRVIKVIHAQAGGGVQVDQIQMDRRPNTNCQIRMPVEYELIARYDELRGVQHPSRALPPYV